jgi:hypothetical protein
VNLDDPAAHAARLRIPGYRVAHLEFLRHATALQFPSANSHRRDRFRAGNSATGYTFRIEPGIGQNWEQSAFRRRISMYRAYIALLFVSLPG